MGPISINDLLLLAPRNLSATAVWIEMYLVVNLWRYLTFENYRCCVRIHSTLTRKCGLFYDSLKTFFFSGYFDPTERQRTFRKHFCSLVVREQNYLSQLLQTKGQLLSKVEASSDKIALSVISNVLNKRWYFKNCVEHCDYSYPWEKVCLLHLKSWGPPTAWNRGLGEISLKLIVTKCVLYAELIGQML